MIIHHFCLFNGIFKLNILDDQNLKMQSQEETNSRIYSLKVNSKKWGTK